MNIIDEDIKNDTLKGIYLIYGTEAYDIQRYIDKMKKSIKNLQNGVNFFVLDKTNIDSLKDTMDSVSFFGLRKFILVKDINLKFNKEILEDITNEELLLVFVEESVDKRTAEYKYLAKHAKVIECNKLNEKDAIMFVIRTLNSYKIRVDEDTAKYLVSVCTEDKQTLINEFRKIVAYLGENTTLTIDTIDKICSKTLDAKIFDLMDMILLKNKKEALIKLDDLISSKTYIGQIVSMMFKQIKQMYQIKLLEEKMKKEGINVNISQELGIHPFVYSKLSKASKNYTLTQLENIILDFDEYDASVKQGRIDATIGLKQIILNI